MPYPYPTTSVTPFVTAHERLTPTPARLERGKTMSREEVDPRVVTEHFELNAILTRPDREAVGKIREHEASREDFVDVVAVQEQRKFGAHPEAPAETECREGIGVLRDTGIHECAGVAAPERVGQACPRPRLQREMFGLLGLVRKTVGPGVLTIADTLPQRDLRRPRREEIGRHPAETDTRAPQVNRGVFRHAEVARRIAGAIIQDVGGPQTDLSLERQDAGDLRAAGSKQASLRPDRRRTIRVERSGHFGTPPG